MPVIIPERRPVEPKPTAAPLWRRLLWFGAFYLVGLGTVAIVALGLRLWLKG